MNLDNPDHKSPKAAHPDKKILPVQHIAKNTGKSHERESKALRQPKADGNAVGFPFYLSVS